MNTFAAAVRNALPHTLKDAVTLGLRGVLVLPGRVMASDRYSVVESRFTGDVEVTQFLLSYEHAKAVAATKGITSVRQQEDGLVVETETATTTYAEAEGEWPLSQIERLLAQAQSRRDAVDQQGGPERLALVGHAMAKFTPAHLGRSASEKRCEALRLYPVPVERDGQSPQLLFAYSDHTRGLITTARLIPGEDFPGFFL